MFVCLHICDKFADPYVICDSILKVKYRKLGKQEKTSDNLNRTGIVILMQNTSPLDLNSGHIVLLHTFAPLTTRISY